METKEWQGSVKEEWRENLERTKRTEGKSEANGENEREGKGGDGVKDIISERSLWLIEKPTQPSRQVDLSPPPSRSRHPREQLHSQF